MVYVFQVDIGESAVDDGVPGEQLEEIERSNDNFEVSSRDDIHLIHRYS